MKSSRKLWVVVFSVLMLALCLFGATACSAEGGFMETFSTVERAINDFAWGPIMLVLLVGTGIWYSLRSGFFQFAKFGHVMKNTLGRIFTKTEKKKGEITPFQALTTAMAGTVGTGNIAGVVGALIVGGPGAIFWMWISALFGMMTKYAEVVLAVKYRERDKNGEWAGGPMYYIKNGLGKNWNWLAIVFCIFGAFAAFGIGNMTQINTIARTMVDAVNSLGAENITGTSTDTVICIVVGVVVAGVTAVVVFGGVSRIGAVTSKLVPFMSLFYILGTLIVIFANIGRVGEVFGSIFSCAFSGEAVLGGVAGFTFMKAMQKGVSRGVFSNEAGLGSAPIAHAASQETNPVKQGMFGVFEVFVDTIVICTLTALVVLMSGVGIPWGDGNFSGATLTGNAFSTLFGNQFASIFIAIAILFFAGSTILSWQLYGQRCFSFLTKGRGVKIYQIIFILIIILGATLKVDLVWNVSDTLNGLMAIPNLVALVGLSGVVIKLTKEYKSELRIAKHK